MLKMAIFFKLIVEIKKKTYISYVFMYMYVKKPQNGLRIKSNCNRAVAHCDNNNIWPPVVSFS